MLPGGTLVSISGLQSEAGSALNGGRGLVIGKPAEDTGRYPVLVYAVVGKAEEEAGADSSSREVLSLAEFGASDLELAQKTGRYPVLSYGDTDLELADGFVGLKRSVKEANLTALEDQKDQTYRDFASVAWEHAYKNDNIRGAFLHLDPYTERWPEDYERSISYANMLRDGIGGTRKKPQEAWRILTRTEPLVDPEWEHVNMFRYGMVVTACDSGQPPQVALDWALQMTKETDQDRELLESALQNVITLVRESVNNLDEDEVKAKHEINQQCCYALLDLNPDSVTSLTLVAGAECLLGDNAKGAKLYRKALESGQLRGTGLQDLKENLALAQMQSPGGSLENYDVLNRKGGKFYAVHKRYAGKYQFVRRPDGLSCLQPLEGCEVSTSVMMELIDIPDPDDEEAFGSN